MLKKKITILILCLAVMTVVSGCGKKQVVAPFPYDDIVNEMPPIPQTPPMIEDGEVQNQKDQKIEEIATTTEEVMDYIEYEKIDTSDWLTYYNNEYGFEIKYPKGWEAEEEEQMHVGKNVKVLMLHTNRHVKEFSILFIREGEDKIHTKENFQNTPTMKLLNPIIVGGYKSYVAYKENNMKRWYYRYFFRTKNKNLYIHFWSSPEIKKEIFYQILNTIKFDE